MEIKLSEYQTGKIIHKKEYPNNFNVSPDIGEEEVRVENESYAINISEKWFDGIHISIAKIATNAGIDFLFENRNKHISFLFCVKGSLNYYTPDKTAHVLTIKRNQHHISLGKLEGLVLNVNETTHYIHIQLSTGYYKKITDQNFADHQKLFSNHSTSAEMVLLLTRLSNQTYSGRAERLYLESKILELIVFFIEKRSFNLTTLKAEDLNKIALAKKIVEDNIQKPFSLIELSRKAGINDYKLKKGFKELTGLTVFGYLFKLRMENAHYFLFHERKQVNEVAFLVGYKNPQHFTAAFKKHFKILPGCLNKQT